VHGRGGQRRGDCRTLMYLVSPDLHESAFGSPGYARPRTSETRSGPLAEQPGFAQALALLRGEVGGALLPAQHLARLFHLRVPLDPGALHGRRARLVLHARTEVPEVVRLGAVVQVPARERRPVAARPG